MTSGTYTFKTGTRCTHRIPSNTHARHQREKTDAVTSAVTSHPDVARRRLCVHRCGDGVCRRAVCGGLCVCLHIGEDWGRTLHGYTCGVCIHKHTEDLLIVYSTSIKEDLTITDSYLQTTTCSKAQQLLTGSYVGGVYIHVHGRTWIYGLLDACLLRSLNPGSSTRIL